MFAEPLVMPGEDLPEWYDHLHPFFYNMLNPYIFWPGLVLAVLIGYFLYRHFKKHSDS